MPFDQFLFATGDEQKWLIADKNTVIGGYYSDSPRTILKSSSSADSYTAKWYRREGSQEDPWVSLTDHSGAAAAGDILYGGNSYGGTHASAVLPNHNGANVFVRNASGKQCGMIVVFLIRCENRVAMPDMHTCLCYPRPKVIGSTVHALWMYSCRTYTS